jgi:hypothetical protein
MQLTEAALERPRDARALVNRDPHPRGSGLMGFDPSALIAYRP